MWKNLQKCYGNTIIAIDYEPDTCLWFTTSIPQAENLEAVYVGLDGMIKEWEQMMVPMEIPTTCPIKFRVTGCANAGGSGLHYHELACEVCIYIQCSDV
jgi:hypothetical protein